MPSQDKKNISWHSLIYVASFKKIISIIIVIVCHFFLVFIVKDLYLAQFVGATLYLLLLLFLYFKSDPINENMLQIVLYEKTQAHYEIKANGLELSYANKCRIIPYKKVEYFSNISPSKINQKFIVPEAFVFGDYAESQKYVVYYLFINKTFYYTAVLPIFLPFEQEVSIKKALASVITFASYKATKDTKFCIWAIVFPLAILMIIFMYVISL